MTHDTLPTLPTKDGSADRASRKIIPLLSIIALIGVALVLAGCTNQTHVIANPQPQVSGQPPIPTSPSPQVINASSKVDIATNTTKSAAEQQQEIITNAIADGTYKDNVTYFYHSGSEKIEIDVTVKNDVITDASITGHNPNPVSAHYINAVNAALPDLVIGKKITELNLPHQISGSSLTTAAFAQHLQDLVNKY